MLFQKKQDGTLRMCVDYRALNKVMIKNKYLIPLATKLFDRLSKVEYFTKLDLRSRYWQVRVAEGDEAKTTCVTRPTLEDHLVHLEKVFDRLRQNQLYVKKEKCEFAQTEIKFLGYLISNSQILMDGAKVVAIRDWIASTKVTELRSFLDLANYYMRFITSYSKIASSLMDLLKIERKWEWDVECQAAFQKLKDAITLEPVLRLPDLELPFEVHTDASDRALGGVLVQEGHPV